VVDAIRAEVLKMGGWGDDMRLVLMEEGTWINIDTEFDFKLAEIMMRK